MKIKIEDVYITSKKALKGFHDMLVDLSDWTNTEIIINNFKLKRK